MERLKTIAIIGAGFSGTALAIQLLRRAAVAPVRLALIDDCAVVGAGVAFAKRSFRYSLNVPAAQMSLDPDRPRDFLDYANANAEPVNETDFLPRELYGEYLRARLAAATRAAAGRSTCVHVQARAIRVTPRADCGGWNVALANGRDLSADELVLALGNPPPARLAALDDIAHSEHYVHDPWSENGWADGAQRVLLLGTGLTAADVVLRLTAKREPTAPEIRALSRHACLPAAQSAFYRGTPRPEVLAAIEGAGRSLSRLVRAVRRLAQNAQRAGGDWREIVAAVRTRTPDLWRSWTDADRRRFLRHVRCVWDAHRHRLPVPVHERLAEMRRRQRLHVHAARLLRARIVSGGVEVTWRERSQSIEQSWIADRIVNCSGPDYRAQHSRDPLVQSLLAGGLISADSLDLGIRTTLDSEVIGTNGRVVPSLYYLGPWLRSRDWEATAVPELRVHAQELGRRLAPHPTLSRKRERESQSLPSPLL